MSRASRSEARHAVRLAALALAAPLLLAGCSSAGTGSSATEPSSTSSATQDSSESAVTLRDGWAKAGEGMTGVFGSLVNNGDTDLTLTKVESPSADMIELHETVTSGGASTMREVDDGFVLPAGGSFELEPGGNHIMFMDMPKALLAGDEVPLTLTFDNDSTFEVTVLVKDFAGAQENYEGSDSHDADEHDSSGDHGSSEEHDANDTGH